MRRASEEKRRKDAELMKEVKALQNDASGRRDRNDRAESRQEAERPERKKSRIAATHAAQRDKLKRACERALHAAGIGDQEQAGADDETECCITMRQDIATGMIVASKNWEMRKSWI
jgi:hypothetical protein